MAKQVVLTVNDHQIRMNDFVQRALSSVVEGFLKALDDVPEEAERIEIVIQAQEGEA